MYTAQATIDVCQSLDSVCTLHLTSHRKHFDTNKIILTRQHHVTVAKGYKITVVEVSTVRMEMSTTSQSNKVRIKNVILNGVLHAPESKESLITAPCLNERWLKVKLDRVGAVIIRQHGVEKTAKRVDRMYVVDQSNYHSAYAVVTKNDIRL